MDNTSITQPKQGDDSSLAGIYDFKDFFSPMLVKEVRQGLRSITFTVLFLVAQLLLCLGILMSLVVGSTGAAPVLSMFIFQILILVVCGAQPLRAANAINGEIKGNTIDLLSITSLSSWKITQGKWVSIMAQSLLFTISLLPFLILRYFLGQMELFTELVLFCIVFILGGVLTAFSVGISALPNAFVRIASVAIVVGGSVFTLLLLTNVFFGWQQFAGEVAGEIVAQPYILIPILTVLFGLMYFGHLALDFAANYIAPVSENRAFIRRLTFFGILIVGVIINGILLICYQVGSWSGKEWLIVCEVFVLFVCTILFLPHIISCITENSYIAKNVVRSLKTRKFIGPFRHTLYPGWGSGALFIVLCTGVLCGQMFLVFFNIHFEVLKSDSSVTFWTGDEDKFGVLLWFLAVLGMALLPAAFVALFFTKSNYRLVFYVVGVCAMGLISIMVLIIDAGFNEGFTLLFCWLPPINLYHSFEYSNYDDESFGINIFFGWFTIIGPLVIIVARSVPLIKYIRSQEKIVAEERELALESE